MCCSPHGRETPMADVHEEEPGGFPWQFRFLIIVIASGVVALILKVLGVF